VLTPDSTMTQLFMASAARVCQATKGKIGGRRNRRVLA
jgi:hypothetical protein